MGDATHSRLGPIRHVLVLALLESFLKGGEGYSNGRRQLHRILQLPPHACKTSAFVIRCAGATSAAARAKIWDIVVLWACHNSEAKAHKLARSLHKPMSISLANIPC